MDTLDFNVYDPVVDITAKVTSGTGLPTTGGTMTGNLIMTSPYKVMQPEIPSSDMDLVNKKYVDDKFVAKPANAGAGNLAIFDTANQTVDSGVKVDTVITNVPSNNTLWTSARTLNVQQHGVENFKSTDAIQIEPSQSVKAFSNGNAKIGPAIWPNLGSTYSMSATGVVTIFNSFPFVCHYRIIFSACDLLDSEHKAGSVNCQFYNEDTSVGFGVYKTLNCLGEPNQFTNTVYMTSLVSVPATSGISVSVKLTNLGSTRVIIDPNAPSDVSTFTVQRVA